LTASGCAPKYIVVDAVALCKDWQHNTVRKADVITEPTAVILEGNNKSRPNWGCTYGENKAS
jgi:hypothetical protein